MDLMNLHLDVRLVESLCFYRYEICLIIDTGGGVYNAELNRSNLSIAKIPFDFSK